MTEDRGSCSLAELAVTWTTTLNARGASFALVKEGGGSCLHGWADGASMGESGPEPELYYGKGVNLFLLSPQVNSGLGSITLNLGMGFSAGRYEDGWGLGPSNPEAPLLVEIQPSNKHCEEFSKHQSVHSVRHICKIAS